MMERLAGDQMGPSNKPGGSDQGTAHTRARPAYVGVRCPHCERLAAEATPGSRLRVKCGRCHTLFEQRVG